jgi:hypothetical protein
VVVASCYRWRMGWTQRVPRCLLPRDVPAWPTVYDDFRKWGPTAPGERLTTAWPGPPRVQLRVAAGWDPQPRAASAIVKASSRPQRAARGVRRAENQVTGRTRPSVSTTLGLLLGVVVHAAARSDTAGAREGDPPAGPRAPLTPGVGGAALASDADRWVSSWLDGRGGSRPARGSTRLSWAAAALESRAQLRLVLSRAAVEQSRGCLRRSQRRVGLAGLHASQDAAGSTP